MTESIPSRLNLFFKTQLSFGNWEISSEKLWISFCLYHQTDGNASSAKLSRKFQYVLRYVISKVNSSTSSIVEQSSSKLRIAMPATEAFLLMCSRTFNFFYSSLINTKDKDDVLFQYFSTLNLRSSILVYPLTKGKYKFPLNSNILLSLNSFYRNLMRSLSFSSTPLKIYVSSPFIYF